MVRNDPQTLRRTTSRNGSGESRYPRLLVKLVPLRAGVTPCLRTGQPASSTEEGTEIYLPMFLTVWLLQAYLPSNLSSLTRFSNRGYRASCQAYHTPSKNDLQQLFLLMRSGRFEERSKQLLQVLSQFHGHLSEELEGDGGPTSSTLLSQIMELDEERRGNTEDGGVGGGFYDSLRESGSTSTSETSSSSTSASKSSSEAQKLNQTAIRNSPTNVKSSSDKSPSNTTHSASKSSKRTSGLRKTLTDWHDKLRSSSDKSGSSSSHRSSELQDTQTVRAPPVNPSSAVASSSTSRPSSFHATSSDAALFHHTQNKKLYLYINGHLLQDDVTLFEAVTRYRNYSHSENPASDTMVEHSNQEWLEKISQICHIIHYDLVNVDEKPVSMMSHTRPSDAVVSQGGQSVGGQVVQQSDVVFNISSASQSPQSAASPPLVSTLPLLTTPGGSSESDTPPKRSRRRRSRRTGQQDTVVVEPGDIKRRKTQEAPPFSEKNPSKQSTSNGTFQANFLRSLSGQLPPGPPHCAPFFGRVASALALLNTLHNIDRYWYTIDNCHQQPHDRNLVANLVSLDVNPVLGSRSFMSSQLSMKASQQLHQYFTVMVNNMPSWLVYLMHCCPYLFSFELRQHFFYLYKFDLARMKNYLEELGVVEGGVSHGDNHEPRLAGTRSSDSYVTTTAELSSTSHRASAALSESLFSSGIPILHRRRMTVSRERLMRDAEKALGGTAGASTPIRRARSDVMSSTSNALGLTQHRPLDILEFQFDDEIGHGLGPTLEFYTQVSQQLTLTTLNLWHDVTPRNEPHAYVGIPSPGLFPRPYPPNLRSSKISALLNKFRFIGCLLARAVYDRRKLDLPLSPLAYKWLINQQSTITRADITLIDPALGRHMLTLGEILRRKLTIDVKAPLLSKELLQAAYAELGVESLYLSFTLPNFDDIELVEKGQYVTVTAYNLHTYIDLCYQWLLFDGVKRQMEALVEGFHSILPIERLQLFQPEELESLFCGCDTSAGSDQHWSVASLQKACTADHGYTMDSPAIRNLFCILSQFNVQERRQFLQFITGSPRLPIGGFSNLKPVLTIVMKRDDNCLSDQLLPSVMTCQSYLKLPNYSTIEKMREKLLLAIQEGQNAFHLS